MNKNLITTEELANCIDDELIVIDGSWYLPNKKRNPREEYKNQHIPGARFFDIDAISDQASNLPHMMPDEDIFTQQVEKLGISSSSEIVIYDGSGLFSAARVWWMFQAFGHNRVRVLDGGLPQWLEAGYPVTDEPPEIQEGHFQCRFDHTMVSSMNDIRNNCKTQQFIILDARSAGRFRGEAPEPRPELSSGHMPGATSLPFTELMEGHRLMPVSDLKKKFRSMGLGRDSAIITSCGSGVTAAIITLALASCGYGVHKLYDGSWTEWASNPDNTILP
jgi:thiosulfate/3-mercaptopyruvate sulfurtransferase